MDDKQFEELMMAIADLSGRITQGFEMIANKLSNNENIPLQKVDQYIDDDDYIGIPLNSMHHPSNPEKTSDAKFKWDNKIKRWVKR